MSSLVRRLSLVRRPLKWGMLLGSAGLLWSCVAPILTVPPPSEVAFSTAVIVDQATGVQQTEWIASGGKVPEAANGVYLIKDQTMGGEGVIAPAANDGSFTAPPMQGNMGDRVLISYQTPYGDYSDSLCVLLAAGSPSACP
jgi:hypothetical protein